MTRRIFDRAFKLKAVDMSYQRDNVRQLAQELGIVPKILYRWRTEFAILDKGSFPGNGNKKMTEHESEIARLKKELNDVRIERDILKKAVGIFSKSDGRHTNS